MTMLKMLKKGMSLSSEDAGSSLPTVTGSLSTAWTPPTVMHFPPPSFRGSLKRYSTFNIHCLDIRGGCEYNLKRQISVEFLP